MDEEEKPTSRVSVYGQGNRTVINGVVKQGTVVCRSVVRWWLSVGGLQKVQECTERMNPWPSPLVTICPHFCTPSPSGRFVVYLHMCSGDGGQLIAVVIITLCRSIPHGHG